MKLNVSRVGLTLAAVTVCAIAEGADPSRYDVGPAPAWVRGVPALNSSPPAVEATNASGGTEYVLDDTQIRVDQGWTEYGHFIVRVTNASGVSDNSNISLSFDPDLDHLTVHSVTLRRAGETIDEMARGKIEILQRESGLENGILNGAQTFHLLMSDVRVGDSIDYSYTIEHREPLWGNRFFGRYLTQWSERVQRWRLRIQLHSGAPLFVRNPPQSAPLKADDGTWQTLEWDSQDTAPIIQERDTPAWYEQQPTIQLSQFATWKELVEAALPLYTRQGPPAPELAAIEKQLTSSAHSDAARALAIIRFVQEDIRYTGLELGSGAYRPTAPAEVLLRRYGDCKDKTLLAVTMMRDLGIDAVPAFVSTRWDNHVHERLPSPGVFNHAIAKVRIGSKTYWIDLTSTGQGGDLQDGTQADFGEALVIAPATTEPEPMPRAQAKEPLVDANAEFDLRAGFDKESIFTIKTVYRARHADSMRRELRHTTTEELGTDYLNFYKKRYPSVRAVGAPHVTDDTRRNEVTISESYRIDHVFEPQSKGGMRFAIDAEIIDSHLQKIAMPVRKTPFDLEFPVDMSEHIRIRLPEDFPVKDDVVRVDTPYFHYDSRVSHSGKDVLLEYRYLTLTDTVPVEELEQFLAKRADAYRDTEFEFTRNDEKEEPQKQTEVAKALEELQHAYQLVQGGQEAKAYETIKALLTAKGFEGLSAEQQHATVYFAGALALDEADYEHSLEYLKRSSDMKGSGADDWNLRMLAASRSGNKAEAVLSLTAIAERWPKRLNDFDSRTVGHIVHEATNGEPGRFQLLNALFEGNYAPEEFDCSLWWRDLALLQLQKGDPAAAQKAFAKVTASYALVGVLSDNRFAPFRTEAAIDIPASIEREIREAREAVRAHPDMLLPIVRLISIEISSLHYAEALQLADDTVKAMDGPKGGKIYTDYRTYRVWLLDARSRALSGLGKWDEAAAQLVVARLLPEGGNTNVSQTINLASLYNDMGKPKEAQQTLAQISAENTSGYGAMQAAIERVASADQLGDSMEVEKQLGFLREQRKDSQATYQRALISANRPDEAAKLLISRLEDPDQRMDALMQVQKYKEHPLPKRATEWNKRWKAMLARKDVREAINRVGTVSEYPLSAEAY
jgi:Domain of Unknown Function with PDB structure (DUF3857)/Transglutaminase-like superfamily